MTIFLKRLCVLTTLTMTLSINVFASTAAVTPAQLDTTTPEQEGALTADQTPSLVPLNDNAPSNAAATPNKPNAPAH